MRPFTAILPARTSGDFAAALQLVREHEGDGGWPHGLDDLVGAYTPPRGVLLVARVDGRPLGVAAVRVGADDLAAVERVYVAPAGRGLALGAGLRRAAQAAARTLGARPVSLGA